MTAILPPAALRQHVGVVGKTGSGKTSTLKLLVEQAAAEGARICILDPIKSDWWGLTSSADGKKAGLPFQILGGPHGHVPLHDGAGAAVGQKVADGSLPLSIIDMADFRPGGLQRFFVAFAEALFRNMKGVVYLVIEEAHEFAPKERAGIGDENAAIHWAKKLATGSRSKGIRMMIGTQRIQALHNAVLGSCETLITHRLTLPADQKPVMDWLKANLDKETAARIAASLSSLKTGCGWICSGEASITRQAQFPRISTFDNSATPSDDAKAQKVTQAPVDVAALRAIIGKAVDEAEANDPKLLQIKVRALTKELEQAKKATGASPAELLAAEQRGFDRGHAAGQATGYSSAMLEAAKDSGERAEHYRNAAKKAIEQTPKAPPHPGGFGKLGSKIPKPPAANPAASPAQPAAAQRAAVPARTTAAEPGTPMSKAERRILTALAQYPAGRTKQQVAVLTGYAIGGGGFNNALGALRSKRWAIGTDPLEITEAGTKALGDYEPLPHGDALLQHWLGQLSKAEKACLEALAGVYPDGLTKDRLAEVAGYEAGGGGFNNALGRLRTLELMTGRGSEQLRASDALFG